VEIVILACIISIRYQCVMTGSVDSGHGYYTAVMPCHAHEP